MSLCQYTDSAEPSLFGHANYIMKEHEGLYQCTERLALIDRFVFLFSEWKLLGVNFICYGFNTLPLGLPLIFYLSIIEIRNNYILFTEIEKKWDR